MALPGLPKLHKKPNPAISPTRPEVSQEGRMILITGGNSGIGFSMAHVFVTAKAKRVIIVDRRADSVKAAVFRLTIEAAEDSPTVVEGRVCEVGSLEGTASFWSELNHNAVHIDTLVLNAASLGKPLLEAGCDGVWQDFITNVRSQLDWTVRFYKQVGRGSARPKSLVSVSTCVTHMRHYVTDCLTSGITKLASTDYFQQLALEVNPEDMQITIFHPGIILTEAATRGGVDNSTYDWDNENLPGHYAVWTASPEAKFIHGCFVWAAWDVEELKTIVEYGVEKNPNFLRAGIEGLSASVNGDASK